jgi:hypothetical protein
MKRKEFYQKEVAGKYIICSLSDLQDKSLMDLDAALDIAEDVASDNTEDETQVVLKIERIFLGSDVDPDEEVEENQSYLN